VSYKPKGVDGEAGLRAEPLASRQKTLKRDLSGLERSDIDQKASAARPGHAEPPSRQKTLKRDQDASAVWSEATTKKDLPAGPGRKAKSPQWIQLSSRL